MTDVLPDKCPFCEPDTERLWFDDDLCKVLWDAFPISIGHVLVIPKQHAASIFQLSIEAQEELWRLVSEARSRLESQFHPDGFNIGLNDGVAAGQTVMHAHIHVIPRWKDDVPDPRGGIRWMIPDKARYWSGE